jgi:uroporphyrinogen decarboxylase
MTHRERAMAAIRHEIPDRVPLDGVPIEDEDALRRYLGLAPGASLDDWFDVDFRHLEAGSKTKSLFGNSGSQEPYGLNPEARPFSHATQVKDIERFAWPSIDGIDFHHFDRDLDALRAEYAIVVGNWTSVFCEVCDFFGMETALMHMYENPALIEATVARIEDFYLEYCRRLFDAAAGRADIFHMWDDFASQRGMIFSPEMWRRYYKPTYRKMFALAKSRGLYVWFHSCGAFPEVLPDLVDIGMDIWETVQAHLPANDPASLKKQYGGRITFCGAINTQQTLPFGTEEAVRREVRDRIRILGANGGYICRSDHVVKRETPPRNIAAYMDEARNFRFPGCTAAE